MMEDEEYPSDSEQSDDDYRPDDRDSEQPSEIDSDGDPEDDVAASDADKKPKGKKRKSTASVRDGLKSKRLRSNGGEPEKTESKQDEGDDENAGEECSDDLWASFLSAANATTSTQTSTSTKSWPNNKPKEETVTSAKNEPVAKIETKPPQKSIVKEFFEFAGEKIEVEKEVETEAEKVNKREAEDIPKATPSIPCSRPSGGLGSILGQIGKKNKLSVLEKTKLDWTSFKKKQGIEEELQVHNKGRDGYLERQDFLQRTDVRRFEIEKSLREVTRKKWIVFFF